MFLFAASAHLSGQKHEDVAGRLREVNLQHRDDRRVQEIGLGRLGVENVDLGGRGGGGPGSEDEWGKEEEENHISDKQHS